MSELHKTDIAIIGAGPVGLFAVFQCGMLGMRAHVIDALGETGGQCAALYPEKPIYDIPGYPEISAGHLIEELERQAAPFDPVYHLGQQVVTLEKRGQDWVLATTAGARIQARAVIIAAGAGAFGPNRPPVEDIQSYEGKSVFYMVRRREDFRGRKIVIAGGGDSAVDWALSLSDVAEKIYVVHRRARFRAAPETVSQLYQKAGDGHVEIVTPFQLKSVEGQNGYLRAVRLISMEGEEKTLEADILLPFFGLASELGPISQWGLNIDKNRIVTDPSTGETSAPGIFAIGDIADYNNKLKLILTGFAEAAQAAHSAWKILHEGQELHFEYSTTKGVPGVQESASRVK